MKNKNDFNSFLNSIINDGSDEMKMPLTGDTTGPQGRHNAQRRGWCSYGNALGASNHNEDHQNIVSAYTT